MTGESPEHRVIVHNELVTHRMMVRSDETHTTAGPGRSVNCPDCLRVPPPPEYVLLAGGRVVSEPVRAIEGRLTFSVSDLMLSSGQSVEFTIVPARTDQEPR